MKLRSLVVVPVFVFLAAFSFSCDTTKDGGIFKSVDMGESWLQKVLIEKNKTIGRANVLTIALDPQNSKIVYLGTRGDGLYKSVNGGQTWVKMEDQKEVLNKRATIHDIAIDPIDSQRIYLATYQNQRGRFLKSVDGGQSWEETYIVSNEKYAVYSVAVDNFDPTSIYIGTAQGGFLKSTDYGKSWKLIKWFDDIVSDIVINPLNTKIMYLSTFNKGIYKTTDKGENWQSFEEELKEFRPAQRVETLMMDQNNPSIIYTGSEYGLLRTTNGGQSWEQVNIVNPANSMPILAVAIEPQNSNHIYYGAGSIIYRSLDKGQNWTVYELQSSKSIKTITIDPEDSNVIYVGMSRE